MAAKNNTTSESAEQIPTAENTPVPGGGSWHWDDTLPGWVENPPYGEDKTAATDQATAPLTTSE